MYETFEHTADLGLRVRAVDLDTLFAEAARGLFSIIVSDLETILPLQQVTIKIDAPVSELLLFDWLNELLFTYESQRLLLGQFDVHVCELGLNATAQGEPIDRDRHDLDHEVKAITYHGLKLEHQHDYWLAEVIVDI
jgi:SHS2 domain-containing protein